MKAEGSAIRSVRYVTKEVCQLRESTQRWDRTDWSHLFSKALCIASKFFRFQKSDLTEFKISSSESLLLSFTVHQRSPMGTKSITEPQHHSNLNGKDWPSSRSTCTTVTSLPAPSRGVLRQPLYHPLCGRHLTLSLCFSYHAAATTSVHGRNANDIKMTILEMAPHPIQNLQYVKALLLKAVTVVILLEPHIMCIWVQRKSLLKLWTELQ